MCKVQRCLQYSDLKLQPIYMYNIFVTKDKESMNDSENTVGCSTHSFYGTKSAKCKENISDLRRKRNLERLEKEICSKKAADALSLNLNVNKCVGSAGVERILTSHPKTYEVFSHQNEAIQFAEKVGHRILVIRIGCRQIPSLAITPKYILYNLRGGRFSLI